VIYGPKSSNLGEIIHAKLTGFEVPDGFGIPFRFYRQHLEAAGIDQQIAALLADPIAAKDPVARKAMLEALRKAIEAAPFSAELRGKVEAGLAALPPNQGVFVRSSTNAEDLMTFSGAGLHETKPNVKGLDAVCDAIKSVWASTWTLRAFDARAHAGIDQAKVFGSALVQVGVPATAAGVVATVHPTDPNDAKNYTINAKSGLGMAVVDGRKVPESLIVSWYNRGIRVLSRSDEDTRLVFDEAGGVREAPNPNKGKAVLTNEMAWQLAKVSKDLTKLFKHDKLDIEWVFVGTKLYIVQTRPLVGQ
jgi:phosphoenolpyruvate synthase/pyruvate phosphate dikinase